MVSTGGYVRHRDRMVRESVYQDLRDTLIACRWMSGTTSRKVIDPSNPGAGWQLVTTAPADVLPLVGKREDETTTAEIVLIDYFPVASKQDEEETGESRKTEKNTFAVDTGVPGEPVPVELGSNMDEQPYVFTMAFYAASDAVALAVCNDLRDRYKGRLVRDDHVDLFNYNDPAYDGDTLPVVRMEVDAFRYSQDAQQVAPYEVHLYFAELQVTDIVDSSSV